MTPVSRAKNCQAHVSLVDQVCNNSDFKSRHDDDTCDSRSDDGFVLLWTWEAEPNQLRRHELYVTLRSSRRGTKMKLVVFRPCGVARGRLWNLLNCLGRLEMMCRFAPEASDDVVSGNACRSVGEDSKDSEESEESRRWRSS